MSYSERPQSYGEGIPLSRWNSSLDTPSAQESKYFCRVSTCRHRMSRKVSISASFSRKLCPCWEKIDLTEEEERERGREKRKIERKKERKNERGEELTQQNNHMD